MTKKTSHNFQDLTGKRFFRLQVIGRVERPAHLPKKAKGSWWACECDCGKNTVVSSAHLKTNRTRSCGCWRRERAAMINQLSPLASAVLDAQEAVGIWPASRDRDVAAHEMAHGVAA